MSSSTEKIKEKLGIVDVISSYLKIEKSGGNYKANCPFHNEKTPSFFISPARESYYCFGCGAKGDIFSFVEQFEGLDFKGALKVLALRAGVPLESWNKEEQTEKDKLFSLMESATIFYENSFLENEDAQDYLKNRGITNETRKAFRIGYAPQTEVFGWRFLTDAMRKKGYSDKELIANGLSKQKEESKSGDIYDRFRDRVMFPIGDTSGRIIAFSGRILHDDGSGNQGGKYINSPETPIFRKGSTLYGLDKAKFEIRKRDFAILVEGQMDLVLSHQAGFTNTVASSGTALSDSVMADEDRGLLSGLGQLNALTRNLIIAYDGDKAGIRAAGRAEKIALSLGMNVKIAKLPKGMDPADVIRKEGIESWKNIVDGAMNIVSLYVAVLMEHPLSDLARIRAVREKILPYIAVMPSAIERSYFIKEIHSKMNIPETALMEDIQKIINDNKNQSVSVNKAQEQKPVKIKGTRIIDRLIGLLFWQETLSPPSIDVEVLRDKLMKILGIQKFLSFADVSKDKKNEYIFEAEVLYKDASKLQKEIDELVLNLEKEILSEALEKIMNEISESEKNGNNERKEELLGTAKDISARLNIINSSRFAK